MVLGDLITDMWQVQWRETLLGWPATNLTISNLTGWDDRPPVRSSPTDRPGRHGQFLGSQKASGRVITVDFTDLDDDPTFFRQLNSLFALGEDDGEEPLVVYLDDSPLLVYARCRDKKIPNDQQYSVGYRRASLLFECTDPRRYGLDETFPTVGLSPIAAGGLVLPLVFSLDFGAGRGQTTIQVVNNGNTPIWPQLTLTGSLLGPVISMSGPTGVTKTLAFDPAFSLAASQQLVIDNDLRTVAYATGQGRRSALVTAGWFSCDPGITTLSLTSRGTYDPSALLAVGWRGGGIRSAYL